MRIKVTTPYEGIPKLLLGEWYEMSYMGMTYSVVFKFTRNHNIRMIHLGEDEDVFYSRKELKALIHADCLRWMNHLSEEEALRFISSTKKVVT